jgi:ATP-dependent Lon protease
MNLYLNVIFKTLLLNNLLKQKHDQLKIPNKPAYVPLHIEERYILMFDLPQIYALRNYNFPKTHFNDINVINKLNEMLETKIKIIYTSTGGSIKNKFLNDIMNDISKLTNIKNKKTLKKKIGKVKNRHELEDKINAKIKKYIKNYLKKKEKQLLLEMQIMNAKKNLHIPLQSLEFNKKENKNKIKNRLDSNINKKINKFNKNINENSNKNKKNTSRKKY